MLLVCCWFVVGLLLLGIWWFFPLGFLSKKRKKETRAENNQSILPPRIKKKQQLFVMTQEQQLNKQLFAQQMLTLDNSRTFRIDSLLNPTNTERKTQKLHPFGCNCSDALSFSSTTSFLNEPDDNNGTSAMLEMYIGLLKEHLLQRDHVVREDTVATIASLPSFLQNLCGLLPQLFQLLNLQQVFGSMSLISRPGVVISPNQLRAIQLVLLLMCTEYHCIHEVLLGTRLLSTVLEIVFMVPEEQLCSIVCQIIRRLLHHSYCERIIQYLLEVRSYFRSQPTHSRINNKRR